MSQELKDRLTRIIAMCEGNSGICNDIRFEASMALQAVESQPVAVIAPVIEWGKRKGFLIQSKCGWYDLRFMTEGEGWQAWSNDDRAFSPLTKLATSEIEAKAACQAHLQAQVNTALEGCNVRPWVDPQGLVEAIKTARPKIIKLLQRFGTMDVERDPLTELDAAIKAWEEAK